MVKKVSKEVYGMSTADFNEKLNRLEGAEQKYREDENFVLPISALQAMGRDDVDAIYSINNKVENIADESSDPIEKVIREENLERFNKIIFEVLDESDHMKGAMFLLHSGLLGDKYWTIDEISQIFGTNELSSKTDGREKIKRHLGQCVFALRCKYLRGGRNDISENEESIEPKYSSYDEFFENFIREYRDGNCKPVEYDAIKNKYIGSDEFRNITADILEKILESSRNGEVYDGEINVAKIFEDTFGKEEKERLNREMGLGLTQKELGEYERLSAKLAKYNECLQKKKDNKE